MFHTKESEDDMKNFHDETLDKFEAFVEEGANIEHDRWARWQAYMFSKSFFPEIASQVESLDLDSSPDGLPENKDFNFGVKTGWNSLRDKLSGCIIIPKEHADRWFRQIITKYADLSETEKESDRKETRNYIPLVKKYLISHQNLLVERFEGMKREVKDNPPDCDCYGKEECECYRLAIGYNQALSDIIALIKTL